ncbi:hypothetical protein [Arthrobacter sp. StoSoilB5]|uniref:hypothetical protein n=1 Tax=Arthrobacter sp. StoSoilB5 TaxID=2830992 RepID=UPI001CC3FD68|nr:hypothetical protein [Arthrobacter sp. StoSoilB5]BCW46641.1 hypothetical protein StoSoilB5_38250 [Arthrobacter sp. StoSoilB5]
MNITRHIKRRFYALGKTAAYSSFGNATARTLLASPTNSPARQFIRAKGLEGSIRRVASETLPQGTFFAKLTIGRWQQHKGVSFRLLQGSEVVYGNKIEPPARGFPLEYRNIVVTSDDPSKFTLDIDAPYELKIGKGAFTTPQQVKYDQQYGVKQHGDVFYSLRGNTTNPTRMLITFPGFGPSTTRISYAVSYLKGITDTDLKDTLMVCFQDRYLSAGSYMMVDSAGRPLYRRVCSAIDGLLHRFKIDPAEILLFGASKGASIAIHYAKEYPGAQLLLAVPQMNLPYYFSKPFFRDNMFRNKALRDIEQPEDRLRQYFAEGRKIDYFYTNSDELSNHSLIELVHDVPNLTKYRIDGGHSDVARAALPAMLGIIRGFLRGGTDHQEFLCEEVREFHTDGGVQLQLRVDSTAAKITRANWFVEGWLGRTRFMQIMSEHSYDFVKFTSEKQQLSTAIDPVQELFSVVASGADGTVSRGTLPEPVALGSVAEAPEIEPQHILCADPLNLAVEDPKEYVVLEGDRFSRFRYRSFAADTGGDTMEIHFVGDAEADVSSDPSASGSHRTSHVAVVEPLDGWDLADLLVLRFVIAAGVERVCVVIHEDVPDPGSTDLFNALDWPEISVVKKARREAAAPVLAVHS